MSHPATIAERVQEVRERIATACGRAGRDPAEVTLVAVSKAQPPEAVAEAAEAGVAVVGENRVQEALLKMPRCPGRLHWHLVGHLQSNKAGLAASRFDRIHSADSRDLLGKLDVAAGDAGRTLPVLLQVNVAGEASKFGMRPEDVAPTLEASTGFMNLQIDGLMTIPPLSPNPGRTRGFFRALRELRDAVQAEARWPLPELSMGMSGDFELAIEEGATLVRVGSLVFGERKGKQWRPVASDR